MGPGVKIAAADPVPKMGSCDDTAYYNNHRSECNRGCTAFGMGQVNCGSGDHRGEGGTNKCGGLCGILNRLGLGGLGGLLG